MTFIGFANQLGLLGLLSLPLILALHLLRQRRRQYEVSSLALWSFLEVEVRGSRMQRIPFSLLLLLDLLIALLLSLAWSQPQFHLEAPVQETRHVLLLLDVSASMRARDVTPSRFQQAQAEALALLGGLSEGDTATVVAFGSKPTWVGDTRRSGLQQLVEHVSALEAGEAQSAGFEEALAMVLGAPTSPETPAEIHVFTDAAFTEPDLSHVQNSLQWHLYGTQVANQAVVHVAARPVADVPGASGGGWQVFGRLANFGREAARRTVVFSADGQVMDSVTLEIAPGATVAHIWETESAPQTVAVRLDGSDALPEDDVAALGLHNSGTLRVGLVASEPGPLLHALESLPDIELQLLTPEEYLPGMSFDILFFRDYLPETWPLGTVAVFDPPADTELLSLQEASSPEAAPVPGEDPLLNGVEFTGVRWGRAWELAQMPDNFESLLQAGSLPLLIRGRPPGSTIYLVLADLESGNLTRHPAFPILVANLVNSAAQHSIPGHIATGDSLPLPDAPSYPHIRLIPPQGEAVALAEERPLVWTETKRPGLYRLELVAADGEVQEVSVGVNAGDLEESAVSRGDWTVDRDVPAASDQATAQRVLNPMPWLLAAALILLLLEAIVAWR